MVCCYFSKSILKICGKWTGLLGTVSPWKEHTQQRGRYLDWRMWRDVKRRRMVKEYCDKKLRVNSLRKNNVIPLEIQVCLIVMLQFLETSPVKTCMVIKKRETERERGGKKEF